MAFVNGVLFIEGETELPLIEILSTISGHSVLIVLYMFAVSRKMCIWYKMNLGCLLVVQICGFFYNYMDMDTFLYLWVVTILSGMGIVFFLLFRLTHKVIGLFGCSHRH